MLIIIIKLIYLVFLDRLVFKKDATETVYISVLISK
jgi:hypothetical protein